MVAAEGRAVLERKVRAEMTLQWGRGLVAAERLRSRFRSGPVSAGFNGAAAWWPRKAGRARGA